LDVSNKTGINIGHVFVGMTLEYFPRNDVPYVSYHSRTFTGDYGATLESGAFIPTFGSVNENRKHYTLDVNAFDGVIDKDD